MKPPLLKTNGPLGLIVAALLFVPALTRAATVIDHVPYNVIAPGEYVLHSDLSANGTAGITVEVANVVIDLNGFTLTQNQAQTTIGIAVHENDVIVRNGTIADFFSGVELRAARGCQVQDLILLHNVEGVSLFFGDDNAVVNCFFIGTGTTDSDSYGILVSLPSGAGTLVKSNVVSQSARGIFSLPKDFGSGFIGNTVVDCSFGLVLGGPDFYEATAVSHCKTPVQGGHAMGENCFIDPQ
jgi:nitrous oxidase accessory protein NosD